MLSSISPVGERGRGQRWAVTVTAYLVGSVSGGATIGLVMGWIGSLTRGVLPRPTALALLAIAAAAAVVVDSRRRAFGWHRQVDETWLTRYRGWVYGLGFGFQLGLGVVTIVSSASLYVMLAAALLAQSVASGVAIGAVYGLVRALPLLATWRVRTLTALQLALRRLDAAAGVADRVCRAALVAVAAVTTAGVLV